MHQPLYLVPPVMFHITKISFAQFASTSKQSSDRNTVDQKCQQKVYSVSPKNALKSSIFWRMWMAEVRKKYLEIVFNTFLSHF